MAQIAPMTDADHSFVPPAVAAAARRAEALQQAVHGTPPVETPPGNLPVPALAPALAPVVNSTEPQLAPITHPTPAPAPAPAPAPMAISEMTEVEIEAALAAPSEGNPELARWQHTIRSMQGRLRAADKRNREFVRQPAPAPAVPFGLPQIAPVPDVEIEQDLVDQYGADLVALVKKIADNSAAKAGVAVLNRVQPALQQVQQTTVSNLQVSAKAAVDAALVPWGVNFDAVDNDDGFVGWLQLTDQMSGAKRHDLFMNAWQSGNATQLTAIMKSYLNEVAPLAAQPPVPAAGSPPAPAARPAISLQALAAPGRAPNASPLPNPQGQPKEIYTRLQVKQFYDRKAAGGYTAEEVALYEGQIAEASREGRIV